ncbi:MAG: AsmA family protein [Candidatus Obscuribacter sp.]|nr:AsmA family protein [Candidatus Obscuribacter sp.]
MLETDIKPEIRKAEATVKPSWLIIRFVLGWLFSIVILIGLALMVNIDWAKPKIEEVLTEQLHRNVHLGHLRWYFGLNGLTLTTKAIQVDEKDGDPFLKANGANIGIAFAPLFAKRVVIKHLRFDHPEFWAIKLKPGGWNFEDLLTDTTEIHLMQVDSGLVHVMDATKEATVKKPFTVSDVNLKFNWPVPGKRLPFYLSMVLPGSNKQVSADYLRIKGFTEAKNKNLKDTVVDLGITAKDVHSGDMRTLLAIALDKVEQKKLFAGIPAKGAKVTPYNMTGLISFDSKLKGSIDKGFVADINTQIKDLVVTGKDLGKVTTKDIEGDGQLSLTQDQINWKNLDISVGGIVLKSQGDLKNWQSKAPAYNVEVKSQVPDISKLTKSVNIREVKPVKDGDLYKIIETATMHGKAQLFIDFSRLNQRSTLLTKLDAEGLPVSKVIEEVAPELKPLLAIVGITEESRMKGHVESHPGRRLTIKDGQISTTDSVVKLDGELDMLRDTADITFDTNNVSLAKVWAKALQDPSSRKFIVSKIDDKTNPNKMIVDGFISAHGKLFRNRKTTDVSVAASIKGGGLSFADKSLVTNNISGDFNLKNSVLTLSNMEGKVGNGGRFSLTGQVTNLHPGSIKPLVDMAYFGSNVEFSHLSRFMTLFSVSLPAITEGHLTGRVRELSIKLVGDPDNPRIFMSASPEDIAYKPPGLTRSLKAVSGNITFADDRISLQDVDIVTRGMKITTSVIIEDISRTAKVRTVHVKSDGVDIADVDYYLASPVLPGPLRNQYKDLLKRYAIQNLHGRIYGDMVVTPRSGKDIDIEGVIGCYSVGALVGQKGQLQLPLEKIAGIIAASGNELLIQDVSGHARSTEFSLNGYIREYKSNNPNWKTELKSTIAPNEFLDLVPRLTTLFANGKLSIDSKGPLQLRAQIQGDQNKNEIVFNAHADGNDHLKIVTPVATINQPNNEELNLDGSMTIVTKEGISLKNTNLLLGDASLSAQGAWKWGSGEDTINLTILSPNPVPAKTFIGLIDPNLATQNMTGTIDGFVALNGPLKHPKLTGKISLDRINNPDFELYDMSGSLSADNKDTDDPYSISLAKLQIDRLKVRKLSINDVGGKIQVQLPVSTGKADQVLAPQIVLSDVTARMAGGLVKVDGNFDLAKNSLAMNAYLSKIQMDELMDKLLSAPNEMTGVMDGEVHITTHGTNDKEIVTNLEGTADVSVVDGVVARFGQLQTKLTQANLLSSGILGFNLNNLLQSVAPFRSGEFNELTSRYQIYKGILTVKELKFSGDDLRMWGAGTASLPDGVLEIDIAGTLPRVSKSRLGGALGTLTRNITVSGLLSKVTFGALENLPSLPIIGDLASDKPRAFAFKVQAPAADSKLVTKSIEKTFHFLPNKQAASAHPVPGI